MALPKLMQMLFDNGGAGSQLRGDILPSDVLRTIEQALTEEQKTQIVQNLAGTFLPLSGDLMSGKISFLFGNIMSSETEDLKELLIGCDSNGIGEDGAFISLRNNASTTNPGGIALYTRLDGGGTGPGLLLTREGNITFNLKTIDLIESIGTNWIRFVSGVQIVWGAAGSPSAGQMPYTFPVPFYGWDGDDPYNATYSITVTPYANAGAVFENQLTVYMRPESIIINTDRSIGVRFMAVGRWK